MAESYEMCETSSSSTSNTVDDSPSGSSRRIAPLAVEEEVTQFKEAELMIQVMDQDEAATGLVAKRPITLGLPPLKMPLTHPGFDRSPSMGGGSTASSLAAARLFKPVTISFKDLSYSVRNGIFRKG